jgi:hypothetical protein
MLASKCLWFRPLFPPRVVPLAMAGNSFHSLTNRRIVRLVRVESANKISFIVISSKWVVSPGNQAMRDRPLKSP